ncbi:hypothetical protein BJF93_17040 [Xaviernesmea oryzae]|uniref:Uncharacterized protein n=1 Tax=Xaviernesmea oryzae TaxID=464029 RepID=A0A1Q9ATB7_9HYPH|nr:hypothetical protein BJF93_17040 [Xaviernesmea oryzae]
MQAFFETYCALIGSDLLYPESDFGNGYAWKRKFGIISNKPINHRLVRLLFQALGNDICIQEYQSSTPG